MLNRNIPVARFMDAAARLTRSNILWVSHEQIL